MYFAHSMPYTYSMLCKYLNNNVTKEKAKRQVLCHSLAGNKVEYLYITGKRKEPSMPSSAAAVKEAPSNSAGDAVGTRTGSMASQQPVPAVNDDEQDKPKVRVARNSDAGPSA